MNRSIVPILMAFIAVACGSSKATTSTTTGDPGPTSGPGPTSSSSTGGGGNVLDADVTMDTTLMGDWTLDGMVIVQKNVTLTLAEGMTLHGNQGSALLVAGTLTINGTKTGPVTLQSATHAGQGTWIGVEVQGGGNLTATYFAVHDAVTAVSADVGSKYSIDHATMDTSGTLLYLNADGTVSHSVFGSDSNPQIYIGDLAGASPKFSDSTVNMGGGKNGNDLIRVDSDVSAPTFDHMELADAQVGVNIRRGTKIAITNSYIHDCGLGVAVGDSTMTTIDTTNFENNDANVGACGKTVDVVATGSYFMGAAFDMSCMGGMENMSAMSPLTGVGPRP